MFVVAIDACPIHACTVTGSTPRANHRHAAVCTDHGFAGTTPAAKLVDTRSLDEAETVIQDLTGISELRYEAAKPANAVTGPPTHHSRRSRPDRDPQHRRSPTRSREAPQVRCRSHTVAALG